MSEVSQTLFLLIRIALGESAPIPDNISWDTLIKIADSQGVSALICDGVLASYDNNSAIQNVSLYEDVNRGVRLEWFARHVDAERSYESCRRALTTLAEVAGKHGIRALLLKGYGLSSNWPVPSHRPIGDIDIFPLVSSDEFNKVISSEYGISIDDRYHHHSVFYWEGFKVENHYDFFNTHSHPSTKAVEASLKKIAAEGTEVSDVGFLLPSPDFNARFLARHAAVHFAADGINLRQILDWALFVKGYHKEIDWVGAWKFYEESGMTCFVSALDEIAIRHLGFSKHIFHIPDKYENYCDTHPDMVSKVLEDVLSFPEKSTAVGNPSWYLLNRLDNWWANRWKHRMVYNDSLILTFLYQIVSHLEKPATLRK